MGPKNAKPAQKKVNFNPELYRFDVNSRPKWMCFQSAAVIMVAHNNLTSLQRSIASILNNAQMPVTLYIFNLGCTSEIAAYLEELRHSTPYVVIKRVIQSTDTGSRYRFLQEGIIEDVILWAEPGVEILSNYWLLHLHKAYYAYFLKTNANDIVFGFRVTNFQEYGERNAGEVEQLLIHTAQNAQPRTSYSVNCKDNTGVDHILDECILLSYTKQIKGGIWAMPGAIFRQMNWAVASPGTLSLSDEVFRPLQPKFAYIENGPVARQMMPVSAGLSHPVIAEHRAIPQTYPLEGNAALPWRIFQNIVVMTVTFNRLPYTKKLIDSLYQKTRLPFTLHIFDQASTDGTTEYLDKLLKMRDNVLVTQFQKNIGLGRAYLKARDLISGDLVVCFDNDIELFSDYWLEHLLKAYYAYFLKTNHTDIALGIPLINLEEYGGRSSEQLEIYDIPAAVNALPRTSYSVHDADLDERILIGRVPYLGGGSWSIAVNNFQKIRWEDHYPVYIRGVASFSSDQCNRLGIHMGYIENGPIARHNGWPYDEEQITTYERLVFKRAVTDTHYLKWRVKNLLRRFRIFGWR